jgi:hypothetical protein
MCDLKIATMELFKEMNRPNPFKRIGIAADHGGYELKEYLAGKLREAGYEVVDFGDGRPKEDDDYPDFIVPLARAVAAGTVDRGVGICGSGVEGFDSLAELALDLRWSWNHATDEVWRQLDPALWEFTQNPWVVLQTVSKDKLKSVLADPPSAKTLMTCCKPSIRRRRRPRGFRKIIRSRP